MFSMQIKSLAKPFPFTEVCFYLDRANLNHLNHLNRLSRTCMKFWSLETLRTIANICFVLFASIPYFILWYLWISCVYNIPGEDNCKTCKIFLVKKIGKLRQWYMTLYGRLLFPHKPVQSFFKPAKNLLIIWDLWISFEFILSFKLVTNFVLSVNGRLKKHQLF